MAKLAEKIFSVTNSGAHKVVRILGITLKFKSRVNMLRLKVEEQEACISSLRTTVEKQVARERALERELTSLMKTVHIAMITDTNYVAPTLVAIKSMFFNKPKNIAYKIYIITTDLAAEDITKLQNLQCYGLDIQIINCQNLIAQYLTLQQHRHVSHAALLKFFLPEILSSIDKVLYIDSDVLVQDSLEPLYETNIQNYYAAVVRDTLSVLGREYMQSVGINNQYYFNSGVLLLNLQKMREDSISQKLVVFRTQKEQNFMDQDAFNGVIGHQVRYVSYKYNFLNYYLTVMNKKQLSFFLKKI